MEEATASASEKKNASPKGLIVVVLVLVIVLAGVAFKVVSSNNAVTTVPSKAMQASAYKNGSYKAEGNYVSPGGSEQIDVTLQLADGKIVAATVISKAFRPNTIKFQGIFIDNFKSQVIGKNIDEVQLDKVSGSSLTPKGFNDAVAKIKQQAQS